MLAVYLAGQRLSLDPKRIVGQGGEAEIYDIGAGRAAKVFKSPAHPDYAHDPAGRVAAEGRLQEHQRKLRDLPRGLPTNAVTPQDVLTDDTGRSVVGYVMPLVSGAEVLMRYARRDYRESGIDNNQVLTLFRGLHETVRQMHRAGVVIGDFNDLNVLARGMDAYLIDVDSYQWGSYPCRVYTEKFLDPLLCPAGAERLTLGRAYTTDADWYAFGVLLMQSLLFVDPYGGVHKPADKAKKISPARRPLERITIFDPEVRYPRPADPLHILPDDLLDHLQKVFVHDQRGEFPPTLLEGVRWTRCTTCGLNHARALCPGCQASGTGTARQSVRIRGQIRAVRVLQTRGSVLRAAIQGGRLRYLLHEGGSYRREDGSTVLHGALEPGMRFRLRGQDTLIGRAGRVAIFTPGRAPEFLSADSYGSLPAFDTNAGHIYWLQGGEIFRSAAVAPERIGSSLRNQTALWAGPRFGVGHYRAGGLTGTLVFSAEHAGVIDDVRVPRLAGQVTEQHCMLSDTHAWLIRSARVQGRTRMMLAVLNARGELLATHEADPQDEPWMLGLRGACAVADALLVPTDEGIARVGLGATRGVGVHAEFPDTQPFVTSDVKLLAAADGLYVVARREITHLKLG